MAANDHFRKLEIISPDDITQFRQTRILLDNIDITDSVISVVFSLNAMTVPTATLKLRVMPYITGEFRIEEVNYDNRQE